MNGFEMVGPELLRDWADELEMARAAGFEPYWKAVGDIVEGKPEPDDLETMYDQFCGFFGYNLHLAAFWLNTLAAFKLSPLAKEAVDEIKRAAEALNRISDN